MTAAITTLLTTIKAGRTWREVVEIIARCGGVEKSPSWWLQIENGTKPPRREDANAVRACFPGWPIEPPTAGELVGALGVINAVVASQNPDTALLIETDGANIAKVLVQVAGGYLPHAPQCLVTAGNIVQVKPRDRKSIPVDSLADLAKLPLSAFHTIRGKTGNLAAIAAAAERAAVAYSTPVTEVDVAHWPGALGDSSLWTF
jgi:hypothetical protein